MNPKERRYYLNHIPMEAALERLWQALGADSPLEAETLPLAQALGRVTAEAIWAKISVPLYHAAAMDGYAVRAVDTVNATESQTLTLQPEQYSPINTGAPLPENYNAVIMIEHVQESAAGITINAPVAPWQHVRMMGEDLVATELVLPANHKLRPVDLGAIAGCGHHQVQVYRQPKVVIIPTGSELVPPHVTPQRGQAIEFNSLILQAQLEASNALVSILPIQPDDESELAASIEAALSSQPDMLLILAGSSAGSKDYTARLIEKRGTLLVHGIAVRPGHPVIMGIIDKIPVFGVPGSPVSATLTGELFIEPVLARWLGQKSALAERPRIQAQLTRKLTSPAGDDDFVRVTVAQIGEKLLASPLARGAGVISSLMRADGLLHIPRFTEGHDSGATVEVILYRNLNEINTGILMMGSHDPLLDLLAQHLASEQGQRLSSVNVGSLGGLIALKRGEAHTAGIHLLNPATGEYNLSYVQEYLPTMPLQLVTFAHREQGLIVAKGNPLNIQSLDDLPRYRFVNRQRGAGTRLLLDYELQKHGINPASITGYQQEEYTHLAIAVAVASGRADCGLGVRRAAIALDLDFISLAWERYDLIIPKIHKQFLEKLLQILRSAAFQQALSHEAGYSSHETGLVQYETS